MAVIQKIRNKYGKLAGAIIALALVGFILMDAASGRFGDLFGRNTSVAKVNGEKIDQKEYSQRTKDLEILYSIYNKKQLDDATRAQLDEEVLRMLVYNKVIDKQCDKLGLNSTKEEERELIYGAAADPMVQQFTVPGSQAPIFANPETGGFDPTRVKAFEQQMGQIDPTGKLREDWEAVKNYVVEMHRVNKFNYLFINSTFTPKFMLEEMAKDKSNLAKISYVRVPVTAINDNEVKVTDEEINDYIKKHPAMFRVDNPSRTIEYVSFDIKPSQEDTAKVLNTLTGLKNDFATTKDNDNFVTRNSDDKYVDMYINKRTYMSRFSDSIFGLPVGSVYGPYIENGSYKLTKVVEKREMPDSVKCRTILVRSKVQGKELLSDSAAKAKIDSIVTAIKGGADFRAMAAKLSDDEGSAKNGGEYTFTAQQKTALPKELGNFVFDGKTGDKKVIRDSSEAFTGYFYTEILEQKGMQPTYKIATISKGLFASDATVNAAYAKATEFAGKNGTAQAFDDAVKKQGLNKRVGEGIKENDFTIQGIGSSREIIRWAYEAKAGDVSSVFSVDGNNRYVVAKLTGIQDKGLVTITSTNRPMLENRVKMEKKEDMIANKYKSVANLQSVAQTSGQQIQSADSLNFGSAYVQNLGYEPKVLGYTFYNGLKQGAVSPAIKGQGGVYFITVDNRWTKPADPRDRDMISQQEKMMEMQTRNGIGQQLQDVLTRNAEVKYYPNNL